MTKRKIAYWVIPPEQDAEFVACMEEVLETYAQAYDPQYPVLCMDEQPVQLLKETRVPIAATTKHGRRVDYEYERNGTASIFMFAEALSGFRQATARIRRTKADWASEVAHMLDTRYAACEDVTPALDINSFTPVRLLADCVGTAEVLQYLRGVSHMRSVCFASPPHTSWLNCNSSDTVGLTPQICKGNHDEPCSGTQCDALDRIHYRTLFKSQL
jgi:hypothetical protein